MTTELDTKATPLVAANNKIRQQYIKDSQANIDKAVAEVAATFKAFKNAKAHLDSLLTAHDTIVKEMDELSSVMRS